MTDPELIRAIRLQLRASRGLPPDVRLLMLSSWAKDIRDFDLQALQEMFAEFDAEEN